MRPCAVSTTILLLLATPAVGQRSAAGTAVIEVGEVMMLRVEPGDGVAALTADAEHRELPRAVRLEVIANGPWQLTAVRHGTDDGTASGAVREDGMFWYRVRVSGTENESEYHAAGSASSVLTRGEAGRLVLELDYRWANNPGASEHADPSLRFTVSPR